VCRGDGQIKIEMHFLPDVYVPCEQCNGKRYNRETLEVRFKGKTIADVLEMPIEEALQFFAHIPKIRRRVEALNDVGLGYMRLGQPATTLSGGEAQRVKLAAELSKVATGQTLYILDEPTTGLHFADIQRLLEVLQRLVAAGNTVVVIEHNLDVIKVADQIIDLGPEGGEEGGRVIATGTPEKVAATPESYTGAYLAGVLPVRASRAGGGAAKKAPAGNGAAKKAPAASNGGSKKAPAGSNGGAKKAPAASSSGATRTAASNGGANEAPAASNGTAKRPAKKQAPARRRAKATAG
jgi:excinuclease ABC subunit A